MAAGLGFKTFTTGEVLTAADTNGYLMQGVLVFASAAARDAAITSPQEGQCCYLKDTDAVQTYSGSAWVGFDDSNAIQNSIVDAKGDIVAASGNDTPARLAVGNNGDTLVADSATATGLAYREDYAAGKNKIINGAFNVWQRGTSFSVPASTNVFTADRWQAFITGTTSTASQQAFTPGTAPVAGYESQYFHRLATGASTTYYEVQQRIEDVRTLAGATATYSFWAKASNAHVAAVYINQNFGVSGSANVGTAAQNISLTTSWQRFTLTFSIPSISGKTVGASSYINPFIYYVSGTVASTSIDIWGVQLEDGSVATAFQTATGTLQGELAACQRYYQRFNDAATSATSYANGQASSTTAAYFILNLLTTMRVKPTTLDVNLIRATDYNTGFTPSGSFSIYSGGTSPEKVALTASTFTGLTQFRAYVLESAGSTAAYIGIGAEL